MRIHRAVLIILMLLGLAVGFCGGLEQAPLGRSVYLSSELRKIVIQEPAGSQIKEVHESLEVCFNMTTVSMYLGVAIAIVAMIGLSIREQSRVNDTPSA